MFSNRVKKGISVLLFGSLMSIGAAVAGSAVSPQPAMAEGGVPLPGGITLPIEPPHLPTITGVYVKCLNDPGRVRLIGDYAQNPKLPDPNDTWAVNIDHKLYAHGQGMLPNTFLGGSLWLCLIH